MLYCFMQTDDEKVAEGLHEFAADLQRYGKGVYFNEGDYLLENWKVCSIDFRQKMLSVANFVPVKVGVSWCRLSRGIHFPGEHPPGFLEYKISPS